MARQKHLETILVLVTALGVLFWFTRTDALLVAAAVLAFAGLFLPRLAGIIHNVWMKLAEGLGYVMSRMVLTLVFFLVLVPIALLSRLFGRQTVQLKKRSDSYFVERNQRYTAESMENVW